MRKGITPILSVVLLLMMTVAAFGLAYFWLSETQKDLQSDVKANIKESLGKTQASVAIISVYESSDNKINISLMNNGKVSYDGTDIWNSGSSKIAIFIDGVPKKISDMDYTTGSDFAPNDVITGIKIDELFNTLDDGNTHEIKVLMPGGFVTSKGCKTNGLNHC